MPKVDCGQVLKQPDGEKFQDQKIEFDEQPKMVEVDGVSQIKLDKAGKIVMDKVPRPVTFDMQLGTALFWLCGVVVDKKLSMTESCRLAAIAGKVSPCEEVDLSDGQIAILTKRLELVEMSHLFRSAILKAIDPAAWETMTAE